MNNAVSIQFNEATLVQNQILEKLLEFSEALTKNDFSKRVITDFQDDTITRIANNLNRYADQMQLTGGVVESNDQDEMVGTFIEVISSYTNLDFKQKLPISENSTIWDAIATGINMLGDELELSTASRQELEKERNALREAKEQAEEANKAKSTFLAKMSHEIRTPLNGILGLTQLMKSEVTKPEHQNFLQMIHHSGKNLSQIINDILDFSKIESGKMEMEIVDFNFRKIVNAEVECYRHLIDQKGLRLKCSVDPSIPELVTGDQVRFTQIVTNLVSNALKFTEHGGIDVSFRALSQKDDILIIQGEVTDTGIGMSEEAQKRVFESFMQADNSIARKYGGTGLGLSIVKSLVQMMHGNITVQSPADPVTNTGSRFIFTLILHVPEQAQEQEEATVVPSSETFNKTSNILIVDDNPINLLVAKMMTEKFGLTVTTCDNGKDAVELIKTQSFDLVFMDIQMPLMDGYETTRQFRKINFSKPIIALSANAYSDDVENSLSAGMNHHIQKPFTEAQILEVLQRFLVLNS